MNSTTGLRKATVKVLIVEVICCPSFYTPSHAQRGHSCTIKHVLEPVLVHSSLPMHKAQTCQSKVTSFSAPNLWAAAQIHGCDSGSSRLANNSVSSPDLCKVTTPGRELCILQSSKALFLDVSFYGSYIKTGIVGLSPAYSEIGKFWRQVTITQHSPNLCVIWKLEQ